MRERIAVIGGGMLGMALALRLAGGNREITILERAPEFGGLAAPWTIGAVEWDRHYHVILRSDDRLLGLLDELGLTGALRWKTCGSAFFVGKRMQPFSTLADFIRFPALGLLDKLRLGLTILRAARERNAARLDELTAQEWLCELGGTRVFERFWRPLLRAKLGDAYAGASAAFIHATIARLFGARGNSGKREEFGYVEGGYAAIIERLTDRLRAAGVRLRAGASVDDVRFDGSALCIETQEGCERYDRVIVTAPAPVAARICSALSAAEREALTAVRYHGIVCASVLLDRPLGGAYVTNIADDSIPFTGLIEMTSLVDRAAFGGCSLVYLPRYAEAQTPIFFASDDSIRESFLLALGRMYPGFDAGRVRAFRVSRVPYVFALPEAGTGMRALPMHTSVPGLLLANSAQIRNGTLNVNQTITLAERAASAVDSFSAVSSTCYEAVC